MTGGAAQSVSPSPFERFRALVLTDASLHERLRATDDMAEFIARVIAMAAERGIDLDADGVRQAMGSPLPEIDALIPGTLPETPPPPAGYLPVRAYWQNGELYLRWAFFGERRLREPFFEGDVQRALRLPFNRLFRYATPVAKLGGWLRDNPGLRPNGLIFHMSRCGSTLVSQMLAALDNTIAVSEASPIDAVAQAGFMRGDLSLDELARWLAWTASALGQPRHGETQYFIKLDCWHTVALPLFRHAFPDVPWVFLYREPVEVLMSQLTMPGTQMVPGLLGPDVLGLGTSYDPANQADYYARALAKVCEPAARHVSDGKGLLINYRQLPQAMFTAILPHFGIVISDSERAIMQKAAGRDAKTPQQTFSGDSESKQQAASPATRAIAAERVGEIYRQLESLRRADARSA